MLEELLPAAVATAELYADPPGAPAEHLYPQEWATVARAVRRRQEEFAAGRLCARRALGALGLAPAPLLSGARGAPQWPAGVVGTLTHCDGFRGAAVARSADLAALGVDAEPNGPLPEGVLELVSLPRERAWLTRLAAERPEVSWGRLLFSAKEAVFKAWYPLTHRELDFTEAELTVDPDASTFAATLLVPGTRLAGRPLDGFAGRWLCRDGLILTTVTVER